MVFSEVAPGQRRGIYLLTANAKSFYRCLKLRKLQTNALSPSSSASDNTAGAGFVKGRKISGKSGAG